MVSGRKKDGLYQFLATSTGGNTVITLPRVVPLGLDVTRLFLVRGTGVGHVFVLGPAQGRVLGAGVFFHNGSSEDFTVRNIDNTVNETIAPGGAMTFVLTGNETDSGVWTIIAACAIGTGYDPGTPADWQAPPPSTVSGALDRLAAVLNTHGIPA